MLGVPAPTYPTESYSSVAECCCNDDHAALARHCFVWPEAPFTVNWALNHHHTSVSREIGTWRSAFRLMSKGCVRLAWCTITVDHLTATRRQVDPGAAFLAYKAALDGLRDWTDTDGYVRHQILADDGPAYVRRVTFHAPVYAGYDALIITMEGPVAAPADTGPAA